MVRINKNTFNSVNLNQPTIHKVVRKAEYDIFTKEYNGKNVSVVQINSYGSPTRKNPNGISQTMQFEVDVIKDLYNKILEYEKTFESVNKP